MIEAGPQNVSTGVRLLSDVRDVFTTQNTDRMATADLIRELHAIEDGPWTDLQGKPLDSRRLAKELERYSVRPKDVKVNGKALLSGLQEARHALPAANRGCPRR